MAPSVSHLTAVSNIARSAVPTLKEAVDAYNRAVFEAQAHIRAAQREAALRIAEARDTVLRAKAERDLENEAIDEYSAAEEILAAGEGEL